MGRFLTAAAFTVVLGVIGAYILISSFAPGDTPEEKVQVAKKELDNMRRMINEALPDRPETGEGADLGQAAHAPVASAGAPRDLEATVPTPAVETESPEPAASSQAATDQPGTQPNATAAASPQASPQAAPAPEPARRTHTVAPGETLGLIASKYYGRSGAWTLIAKANPSIDPDRVGIGTKLVIPSAPPQAASPSGENAAVVRPVEPAPQPAADQPEKPETYVVQSGDTLCKIARKFLGDGNRYEDILRVNPGLEPDRLLVGQKIRLP